MAITSGRASNKHDHIIADHQNDWISSGNGNDVVDGGAGSDDLAGGNGEDLLLGGLGNDIVSGGNGKDRAYGGGGNDLIGVALSWSPLSENGNDTFYGDGYDTFRVISGAVVLGSLDSNGDFIAGATTLIHGHDVIHGGNGTETIYGDSGDNAEAGGNDLLFGAAGSDAVYGEGGDDIIVGGAGADVLTGGSGEDLFVYDADAKSSDSSASTMDRIADFQPGADLIDLRALLGGYDVVTGTDANELAWGGTTATANGVWYQHSAGSTYVYADVNGSAASAELVICLDGLHDLQATDFLGVAVPVPHVGQAIDGYIVGATVFADGDNDGLLDANDEAHTTTGANGLFTLVGGSGPLVLTGGTDISTGLPFAGTLRAPEGSSVVTPLTTLVAAIVDSGTSAEDAELQVEAALGLPDIDLTAFDPVQAALDGDAAGLAVYSAGVQVQNTIALAASLIDGAGTTGFDPAAAAVVNALADAIAGASGALDLGDAATAGGLIVASAAAVGVSGANIDNTAADAAAVIAAINSAVSDAAGGVDGAGAALTEIAQTAIVAQDTENGAAAALADAGSSGDSAAAAAEFTGGALDDAIDDAADQVGAVAGTIFGTSGDDTFTGGGGSDAYDGLGGNDTVFGGGGSDYLFGGDGNDTLRGEAGDDELRGGAGDDILVGGGGRDLLDGGNTPDDIDVASYLLASSAIQVNLAATPDPTYGIDARTAIVGGNVSSADTLINIEAVTGTAFDDIIIGDDGANRLRGEGGADTLVGAAGNDTLIGGAGIDWADYRNAVAGIVADLALDEATDDGDGGSDLLISVERIRGSAFDDLIYGSDTTSGNERFEGMAGNDTIDGRGGVDHLHYQRTPTGVTVTLSIDGSGTAADGAGGIDTFFGIEGVRGSGFNDVLTGTDRTDTIEFFEGMGGDDSIDGHGGIDRADYAQAQAGVIVNLATGVASDGLGGTDSLSGIEQVNGSPFDDVLIGGASDDRLTAGAGNDTLNGGAGVNFIDGGAGTDTLSRAGATTNQSVDLAAGTADADTILGIENVIGSDHDDTIRGDFRANRLEGGSGNDTYRLIGFTEADTIIDSAGTADRLEIVGTELIDIIEVSWSGTGAISAFGGFTFNGTTFSGIEEVTLNLLGNVEGDQLAYTSTIASVIVTLGGAASGFTGPILGVENVVGGSGDDTIVADNANNHLQGGAGNDWIKSGDGNDTIDGGEGIDTIDLSEDFGAHHIDLHDAFLPTAFDLVFNVENIVGSNGDDRFAGSFEANIISGGGGNDLIEGDAGSDTLAGGSGSDTFRWNAGDEFNALPGIAIDSIADFETGVDGDVLDLRDFLVGDHWGTPGNLETFFDFSFDGSSTIIDVSSQRFPGGPVDQQIVLTGVDLTNGGSLNETQVIQNLLTGGNLVVDF